MYRKEALIVMNKCKNCELFKNGCGFSIVDEQLGLDGNFVACGQFVKANNPKDCLSCSNSFSGLCNDGDILHCMERDGVVVEEDGYCIKWN